MSLEKHLKWNVGLPTIEVLAKINSDLFHHKDLNNHDDVDEQCE